MQMEMIHNAASALAQNAFAMSVIHQSHQVILFGNFHQLIQRRDIAIHGEDAIANDNAAPVGAGCLLDFLLQIGRIAMGKTDDLSAGEARAIDNASVIELIREDDILFAHQRWNNG